MVLNIVTEYSIARSMHVVTLSLQGRMTGGRKSGLKKGQRLGTIPFYREEVQLASARSPPVPVLSGPI